jgi:hypothetical protein
MKSKRNEFLMNIFSSNVLAAGITCALLFTAGQTVNADTGMAMATSLTYVTIITIVLSLLAK